MHSLQTVCSQIAGVQVLALVYKISVDSIPHDIFYCIRRACILAYPAYLFFDSICLSNETAN